MKRSDSIRFISVHLLKRGKLVAQDVENETRIHFRIIHMTALKAAVVIVLNQVMIGIPRECQRIEPECINRGIEQPGQCRLGRDEMWQIVMEDIVTENMPGFGEGIVKTVQPLLDRAFGANHD
ncbi:MAG: hypothetical protein ABW043_12885 [Devosia sp.]|uniref:hypothetical protein n=1 Tax=Devosia sp. TaxID=1871048 RepID=UPI0033961C22